MIAMRNYDRCQAQLQTPKRELLNAFPIDFHRTIAAGVWGEPQTPKLGRGLTSLAYWMPVPAAWIPLFTKPPAVCHTLPRFSHNSHHCVKHVCVGQWVLPCPNHQGNILEQKPPCLTPPPPDLSCRRQFKSLLPPRSFDSLFASSSTLCFPICFLLEALLYLLSIAFLSIA